MEIWYKVKSFFGAGVSKQPDRLFQEFQAKLGYHFKNPTLLLVALTHRSYAKSQKKEWLPSNERLEFLGDSVLGLVTADFLYGRYPDKLEGGLTKKKSLLVNEAALHRVADELKLGKYILLSPDEDRAGGRKLASINADTFEAVIGAIYLDGGLEVVRQLISRILLSKMDRITSDSAVYNYKGDLLEFLQAGAKSMPRYEVTSESGPDHDKVFTVAVYSNGIRIGSGAGSTKKDAEQKAAAEALAKLKAR